MQKYCILSLLAAFFVIVFGNTSIAQEPNEASINSEYRGIILDHLKDDVAQRQITMQRQAEQMLLQLPLNKKLYDESEVRVKTRIADGKREDGKPELNYVMEISYNCSNIEGFTDDYPAGVYALDYSNSASAICDIVRAMVDRECADIFAAGKKVTIRIASSTDAIDISHIPYKGEYGEHRYEAALYNGENVRLSLLRAEGINNNAQLAFARAQGVRNYLETQVPTLKNTVNDFGYITRCSADQGAQYRRCSIELTVHGAFDETIISMNEKLINDDYIEYNIPLNTPNSNPQTFVLIIANEHYDAPMPNCEYARRDGAVVRDYCQRTLGVPERHIKILNDASVADIKKHGIKWLKDITTAVNGNANIIIYYSGHGISDLEYKPYLIPCGLNMRVVKSWNGKSEIDPDATLSKRETRALMGECLSLDTLCSWFNRVPVKGITFILDAGFNGRQRNGEILMNVPRSKGRVRGMRVREDITIFTAADVTKNAYAFEAQQHGFLTFFMMKELKRTKGDITYGALFSNVSKAVSYESSLQGKLQEPFMVIGGKIKDAWVDLRFMPKEALESPAKTN